MRPPPGKPATTAPGRAAAWLRGLPGLGRVGVVLLGTAVAIAILAPVLAPYDPAARVGEPFERPDGNHLLGTNDVGQDILSELIYAGRISLLFGFGGGLVATALGVLVGLSSGYLGGRFDALTMRIVDLVLVMPFLPLLLVLAAFLGAGIVTEIVVISAVMWAPVAREIRAQTLSLRERGYVQAALAIGARPAHVLRRHLLPGVATLVPPQFIRAGKGAILLEASLSFLGLGDPTVRSWGTMLYFANARSAFLTDAWLWWVIPPGLCIGLFVLGFALAGTALEDWGGWVGPRGGRVRRAHRPVASPAEQRQARVPAQDARSLAGTPLVSIRGLEVGYGSPPDRVRALRGVDLDLLPGEVVGVVGESGSGKTTLLGAMIGLLRPPGRIEAGSITFDGIDLSRLPESDLRRLRGGAITLVPQSGLNALNPVVRVGEQIVEQIVVKQEVSRLDARRRAAELLISVGIGEDRHRAFPHELSGGMRQRALIAMALAPRPRLVLADEPTTGLDGIIKIEVLDLLAEAAQRAGSAMLLVSHDLPAVLRIADRVVVMRSGEVVEHGAVSDVSRRPQHPYTRALFAALPRREVPTTAAAPRANPVLRVTGVAKRYRSRGSEVAALDGVDLTVDAGEIVGLVGRSGAGKTTLARLLFGLEVADRGTITIAGGTTDGQDTDGQDGAADGMEPRRRSPALRLRQLVMQDPYATLPPHFDVYGIVAEPLVVYGDDPDTIGAAVNAALRAAGLQPAPAFSRRYPGQLSGGERQRVALARALVVEPALIVADEPASLLDVPLRAEIVRMLAQLRETRGTAVLYITHDIGLAAAFCDRLAVVADGRIVEVGPTERLLEHPEHAATRSFVEAWHALAPVGGEEREITDR